MQTRGNFISPSHLVDMVTSQWLLFLLCPLLSSARYLVIYLWHSDIFSVDDKVSIKRSSIDEKIVHKHLHYLLNKISKNSSHATFKSSGCITQPKQHSTVSIHTIRTCECHVFLIIRVYHYLRKSRVPSKIKKNESALHAYPTFDWWTTVDNDLSESLYLTSCNKYIIYPTIVLVGIGSLCY